MISDVEDLLTKIFLLLPTKTLVRFQFVCRHWQTLISDRHFRYTHTINGCRANPECLLLHRPRASRYYLLLRSLSGPKLVHCRFPVGIVTPTICSVSNGLFLLESSPEYCHVYNPATRQSRRIPLPLHAKYTLRMGMTIAFDPLKSRYFKIVCMRAARNSGLLRIDVRPCQIEVYDSRTNTWTYRGSQFYAPVTQDFDRGVFWNGAIHWSGTAFDLETFQKKKKKASVVRVGNDTDVVEHYVEVNGHLKCIAHSSKKNLVEVFEWDDSDSYWDLKIHGLLVNGKGVLSVLGIYWGDKEGDRNLVVHDNETGKVVTCGLEEEVVKELVGVKVKIFYEKYAQFNSCYSFQFLETLAHV